MQRFKNLVIPRVNDSFSFFLGEFGTDLREPVLSVHRIISRIRFAAKGGVKPGGRTVVILRGCNSLYSIWKTTAR